MANWALVKYEYDADDNLIYLGMAKEPDKNENSDGWYIKKYTWVGGNMVQKQKKTGAWSKRSTGW